MIVHKDSQGYLSDERINRTHSIFDKLGIEELGAIGHSDTCETKAFVKTITLFEGRRNDLYLPFDEQDREPYYWRTPDKRKELFMRNVLIKDFRFTIPVSASIFEIKIIVANINSRKFIPDISRNNLDTQAKDIINYLIGKAIHLGASNLMALGSDEKLTLQNFISTFYKKVTEFEK